MSQRLRLRYRTSEPFQQNQGALSHAWHEAFAAAGFALGRGEGSKRPRIELGPALPAGATGTREVLDAWLADGVAPHEACARLARVLPSTLALVDIEDIGERLPSLGASTRAATYLVRFAPGTLDAAVLRDRIKAFLARDSFAVEERRGDRVRRVDVRALVRSLRVIEAPEPTLELDLVLTQEHTGRTTTVLAALGIDAAPPASVVRTEVEVAQPRIAIAAWRERGRFA